MLPNFLIPESLVREGGTGPVLDVSEPGQPLIVTLGINRIIEQESLDVWIRGSADGANWGAKPLLRFPQKFYCGSYTMILDPSQNPEVRFLRAEYKLNRWGRGSDKPLFGFYVFVESASDRVLATSAAGGVAVA